MFFVKIVELLLFGNLMKTIILEIHVQNIFRKCAPSKPKELYLHIFRHYTTLHVYKRDAAYKANDKLVFLNMYSK